MLADMPPDVREQVIRFAYSAARTGGGTELPEGTRFHDLRDFYASALIAAGLHRR